jgi:1,4-dihydroxy-2-naphthoate octaprenyltransferase
VLAYGFGVALAASAGAHIEPAQALLGQLAVTATQLVAQYANEYYDQETDRLNAGGRTRFSGGSGVLAANLAAPNVARNAALACATVSLAATAVIAFRLPVAGLIGVVLLFGSWFYSAPPLSAMGSGFGELWASVIVAVLTPLLGYVMQTGHLSSRVIVLCLPLLALEWAMLLVFELPDRFADERAGKRTLAVRLGARTVARLHNILIIAAFALLAILYVAPGSHYGDGEPAPLRLAPLALMPLGLVQIATVTTKARSETSRWGSAAFGALALLSGTLILAIAVAPLMA